MPDVRSACSALGIILALAAAPASAQSLSDAYAAALRQDPDHTAAAAERDAAQENEALARVLFRPKAQVQGNAGYSRVTADMDDTSSTLLDQVDGLSGGVLVGVEQPIISGEARAQQRQLRAGARAGDAQYEASRQQLALRVAQAYFDVLRAKDTLASLTAQEESARREQRAAQARFDAGWAKITDVREAQARGDGVAAQIVSARAQSELAVSRFRELTGFDGGELHLVRSELSPAPPIRPLPDWQDEAEAQAPVIHARREQLAANEATVDQYRWSSQVQVTARGAYGQTWRGGNEAALLGVITPPGRVGGFFAGLQAKIPLYTGGALEAQRRQATSQAASGRARLDAARRDVRLQVEQAWLGQRSSAERAAALRTALASAELQERAALTGREVGVRTQSDVLAAQAQTFEISRQLNDALYSYEYSRVALAAVAGVLTPDTLAEIDRDLTPR
ncbi:TolC-like protein [Caenibius tardaugens NBRC 16725]|uniref:TolC-like protein n=1 Tax=Caenibius tardaugens NBRC 16725 TaxID=1219035 RepID=U2YMK6_9SPHN|nr:TolC family outer membrane protein [Caenibius tardaugens]AZI37720.1 hypothetical protein EGO55_18585 [Caenibius tardaugens NBRC 16725]GAD49722.1 TolC-like protein [Caenibius tardaugens NBRC 16725]